jgi:hypothetical protein
MPEKAMAIFNLLSYRNRRYRNHGYDNLSKNYFQRNF